MKKYKLSIIEFMDINTTIGEELIFVTFFNKNEFT